MSSAELTEWMAYYQIEPFGEQMQDLRTGIVASTVANANRSRRSPPARVEDFMPKTRKANAADVAANLKSTMRSLKK